MFITCCFCVDFINLFFSLCRFEDYLSVISEQTFLDLFKKDRFGFNLSEGELGVRNSYFA